LTVPNTPTELSVLREKSNEVKLTWYAEQLDVSLPKKICNTIYYSKYFIILQNFKINFFGLLVVIEK